MGVCVHVCTDGWVYVCARVQMNGCIPVCLHARMDGDGLMLRLARIHRESGQMVFTGVILPENEKPPTK